MQCMKTNDATLLFSLLFKFLESRDLLQFHRSPYCGLEIAFPVCVGDWQPFQLVSPPASVKVLFGFIAKKPSVKGSVPPEEKVSQLGAGQSLDGQGLFSVRRRMKRQCVVELGWD